jgi:flagellar biosynthesis/type III secretory pathway protein FliH
VLLEILDGSKEETDEEQALAEQARDAHEREVLESKAEGKAEGLAEGKAKGLAEGEAKGEAKAWQKMISSLNIRTVGEFRDKFHQEPPPEVMSVLEA